MQKTVYFRTFEEEDVDLIYKWMNDDELKKLSVGLNRRMSKEECRNWVLARKNHNPYQVWWAICAIDTDKMIGYASITNIHYINSSAETGAVLIGDSEYNDGFAWLETVYHMFEYAFESLGLNRVYGESLVGHPMSNRIGKIMFMTTEGILRQAAYKNGRFYDLQMDSILRDEYFAHRDAGDYDIIKTIRRLRKILKEERIK